MSLPRSPPPAPPLSTDLCNEQPQSLDGELSLESEMPVRPRPWIRLSRTVSAAVGLSQLTLRSRATTNAAEPFKDRGMTASLSAQGDYRWHHPDRWQARLQLRRNQHVLQQLDRWWSTVDRNAGGMGLVKKRAYCDLQALLAKALLSPKDYCPDAVKHSALEEWNIDSKGKSHIGRDTFLDSMFELADLWTFTVSSAEYVRFLSVLLDRVSKDGRAGRVWRSVDDVKYMSDRLWSPELLPCWHPSQTNQATTRPKPAPASKVGGAVGSSSSNSRRPVTAPMPAKPGKNRSRSAQLGDCPRGRGHRASSESTKPAIVELGAKINELVALAHGVAPAEGAAKSAPTSRAASPPPEAGPEGCVTRIGIEAAAEALDTSLLPLHSQLTWQECRELRPVASLPALPESGGRVSGNQTAAAPWAAYEKLRRMVPNRIAVGPAVSSQSRNAAGPQQLSLSAPF